MKKKNAMENVKENPAYYKELKDFHNDKDITLIAVKGNGLMLEFASEELKNDKEIVLHAVKNKAYAICFANPKFLSDEDVVLMAVKNSAASIAVAQGKARKNEKIAITAIIKDVKMVKYVDVDVLVKIFKHAIKELENIRKNCKKNQKIIIDNLIEFSKSAIEFRSAAESFDAKKLYIIVNIAKCHIKKDDSYIKDYLKAVESKSASIQK